METRKNKTAVIYARVSSTGDRQSTERQVQDLNEYAKYRGYNLVRKPPRNHVMAAVTATIG